MSATAELAVPYGDYADHVADIHIPSGAGTADLVLLIHGGDWQQAADRSYLNPMVESLVAAGHVVASIEYRRLGGAGGWPATFDDVALALEAVPPLAAELARAAGTTITATVLVGHSAGGQLALWAAAQPVAVDPPLVGVLALGPTADLTLGHATGAGGGAIGELLGGSPAEVPEIYARADPARLTPRVPVRVLHASQDPIVPVALARSYAKAVGSAAAFVERPGDDHFTFTTPGAADWAMTLAAIDVLTAQMAAPASSERRETGPNVSISRMI